MQQQELSEGRVSGCHSFLSVPLFVPSLNSLGQILYAAGNSCSFGNNGSLYEFLDSYFQFS